MPLQSITDLKDPRIAPYANLRDSRVAHERELFVCEGRLLVNRLLASRFAVESLMLEARYAPEYVDAVPPDTPIFVIPDGSVEQVVGFDFHRGILACGRRATLSTLPSLSLKENLPSCVVVCVNICDPENLGSIIRNAAAFGALAVIVGPRCADAFSRRTLRTSMGTNLSLPICEPDDITAALAALVQDGFQTVATVVNHRAEPLNQVEPLSRFALVFGNEGHGLEALVADACQRQVTIPMQGGTDSLNVATASAIFLYHFLGHTGEN